MASRSEANILPPAEAYPRCEVCGWHDRKLRSVGLAVTPDERVAIHKWARHSHPLPEHWFKNPEVKDHEVP